MQKKPAGMAEVNQTRQINVNHDPALEAQKAMHDEREYWRERNRQEDDHHKQMQNIREAL